MPTWSYYECRADAIRDSGHISARMAQNLGIASNSNIFQLIQSKNLRLKAKTIPNFQKRPRVSDLLCAHIK